MITKEVKLALDLFSYIESVILHKSNRKLNSMAKVKFSKVRDAVAARERLSQ